MKTLTSHWLFLVILPFLGWSAFAQGPLTPPGAPAASMKTLDQVEARVPVDALHTPGDSSHRFVIMQPGSYYLTGNITGVAGKGGILVDAGNVTIDLNGFGLVGVSGSLEGITSLVDSVTIRNGTVSGWGSNGINGLGITRVYGIQSNNNGGTGVVVGDQSSVTDCNAIQNTNFGIHISQSCQVVHCTASENTNAGIEGSSADSVLDCVASNNRNGSLPGWGIQLSNSALVSRCACFGNNTGASKSATEGLSVSQTSHSTVGAAGEVESRRDRPLKSRIAQLL